VDVLRDLVRNVSLVVLIASFIDLLLPGNQMDRYLKLITGLFILISIFNPVMNFLDRAQTFEMTAWQYQPNRQEKLESIFRQGEEIARVTKNAAWHEYKQRVERQIVSLVKLVPGVKEVQVDVQVESREKAYYGAIRQVVLVVTVGPGEIRQNETLVNPVRVEIEAYPAGEASQNEPVMRSIKERAAVKNGSGKWFVIFTGWNRIK